VDTLAFWAFHRSWIDKVGYFDQTLLANEDYDFNSRFRAAGGRIWLDPTVSCVYYARSTFASLARQYWRYGYWKAKMAMRFPETLRWRQFLPPSVLLAGVLMLLGGFLAQWLWWILAAIAGLYTSILLAVGTVQAIRRADLPVAFGMPIAIAIMHVCWAAAFLWSFASGSHRR
jgi:GT2 family glycosyltransferase